METESISLPVMLMKVFGVGKLGELFWQSGTDVG